MIILYYPVHRTLEQGWVRNYWPQNPYATNALKYVAIDLERKRELLKRF